MAISTVLEQVGTRKQDGTIAPGLHREVLSGVGAARTLVPRESGSLCLFDSAAGNIYTLPAPVLGMQFEFFQTITVTSNAAKIITSAADVFLLGEILIYTTATAAPGGFALNGTTHRAISSNGTTTGGVIGSRIIVTAISATQWVVTGALVGSGTVATPAATS